jgi:catechol 2,3-dioxygenase-like lactoylglutathione lyase family enzyme
VTLPEQAIPVLRCSDAAATAEWYRRLGFEPEFEHRFGPNFPLFIGIVRDDIRLFLSEHAGDGGFHTLVYLRLRDLAAVAREFGTEVIEQDWGGEVHLTDPGGNRLRVGWPKGEA